MDSHEVDLFIHREGIRPKPLRIGVQENLTAALKLVGIYLEPGMFVFIGESDHALGEPLEVEDGEDAHEVANPDQTLAGLGLHRGGHVHCHRCHRVAVSVNYGPHTKRHRFSPAATIAVVTEWAKGKFKLTDTDALTYVLQFCNSTQRPRPDEHLGELVKAPNCDLCFDLVPDKTKVEG